VKAWVFGDNVDTDAIVPGRYMKFGIDEIARHCMETLAPAFANLSRRWPTLDSTTPICLNIALRPGGGVAGR